VTKIFFAHAHQLMSIKNQQLKKIFL